MSLVVEPHDPAAGHAADHTRGPFVDNVTRQVGGIIDRLRPHRGPSRLLGWATTFWLASAVFHLVVFAVDGGAWAGPLSWRKPIVFSLSVGLLLWAFGWLLDHLPHRRRLAWGLAITYAVASTIENGLIITQTWRGEASHFNSSTPVNIAIFSLMGAAIVIMSLAILAVVVWSLIERPADPIARSALYWGFGLVVAGLGIGPWIIQLGNEYAEQFSQVPSTVTYGDAGVAKFPHAVAFHGIQVFALASAMLGVSGLGLAASRRLMRVVVASYLGVFVFSAFQTGSGRAPTDVVVGSAVLLGLSTALLVVTMAAIARAVLWPQSGTRPRGNLPSPTPS